MTSTWVKIKQPHPVSLEEIISEEIARELQTKKDKRLNQKTNEDAVVKLPGDILKTLSDNTCNSDVSMPKILPMESDNQLHLKRLIIPNNIRDCFREDFTSDSDDEEIFDSTERKFWDRFESLEPKLALTPQCFYKGKQNIPIMKDDEVMCELKRTCELKLYPYKFLSESMECNIERYTYIILYKMVQNRLLKTINGVFNVGREALILHANPDFSFPSNRNLSKEFAIKIFKSDLTDFKGLDQFEEDDHRFKNRKGKQASRKTINISAEREMINLMQMQKVGIPCPKVVALRKNVLVMEFIGDNQIPAPALKDITVDVHCINAYEQVVEYMKILYTKANLIHADLTEDNILWHQDKCYFIDVSESVEPSHEQAFFYLYRDCNNVITFFSKRGVPNVVTIDELFRYITGFDFGDRIAQANIRDSLKLKPHIYHRPSVELNYCSVCSRKKPN
ncbi:serine/threonine-protein kinase RIO3-like [Diabrotica undecimpunctata]|uniref:serine/threonine-protein kinase RIO3-like n=1 Tax=Diabrotica undecimpunctata TaxID=50387 RepID=UPI003B63C1C1